MNPQERGAAAVEAARNPVLRQGLDATREWAMQSFQQAKSPEEAWNARLRVQAVEEFVAYLMAVIQLGRSETAKLEREYDKMRARKKGKISFVQHLDNARRARAEFEEMQQKVANE